MPWTLLVATCLAVAACGVAPRSAPATISAEAAGVAAITQMGGGPDVRVVSTRLSTYGAETSSEMVPALTPVWVVVLSGMFNLASCGPVTATPHPCPSPATSAQVLIDARTGAFIQGTIPGPLPS